MRTILAAAFFLIAAVGACRSGDPVVDWLDRAADARLTPRQREYAARQVIMLADSSASILIFALRGEGSDSGLRRQIAARILGELAPDNAETPLLEAAFGEDYFLAEAAAAALARLYARRGDEELLALFKRGAPEAAAVPGEADGGRDDWVALSIGVARNRGRFRGLLMRGLALKCAAADRPIPPALTQCVWDGLLDADRELRLYSLRTAANTGDDRAAEKVAAFLYTENDPRLLVAALRAMAEMRPPDYGEAVERHVDHADPMVALEALAALDAMGYPQVVYPAGPGARAVAVFVGHPSTPVRRRAVELLAAGKNPAALPYLRSALFDRVAANRSAAAAALGDLGFTGAVGALNPLLRDDRPEVRHAAALSLSRLGVVGVAASVLDDLNSGSPPLRSSAAETLGRIGDARAVPALIAALADPDGELACLAAEALGRLNARQAGKGLYALMTGAGDEATADAAREALFVIYGDDPGMSEGAWQSWARRNRLGD